MSDQQSSTLIARQVDSIEQAACSLLARSYPNRRVLAEYVAAIISDPEYIGSVLIDDGAPFIAGVDAEPQSGEEASEMRMADRHTGVLADAVIARRRRPERAAPLSISIPVSTLALAEVAPALVPTGLAAAVVEYVASLTEMAARWQERFEDAR
mgnify:FL=1